MPVRTIWSDRLEALQQRFKGSGVGPIVYIAGGVLIAVMFLVRSLPDFVGSPAGALGILVALGVGVLAWIGRGWFSR